jgi:hypothetical protein
MHPPESHVKPTTNSETTMPKDRLEIFVEKVNKMRACQHEFFRARSQGALIAAKQLEKEVDQQLAVILGVGKVREARDLAEQTYARPQ